MNTSKKYILLTLLISLIFVGAACSSAGGSEPAVNESTEEMEEMEEMEDGESMEGMEHDDDSTEHMDHDDDSMEHMDHDDEHSDHDHDHDDDSARIMNDGATIAITSPATGDTFAFGEQIILEIDVDNFELGADGNHWHVYIDGSSWGMVLGGNLDQPLVGLEPGQHMIEAYLANGDHQELMQGSTVMIVVEEQ
ncbi:MAG: hypothetical protein AAF490_16200 [Chloroflexota bacterium]